MGIEPSNRDLHSGNNININNNDTNNSQPEPPQKKHKRFKRPISQKACELCRKRRVRCDANAINWPNRPCTNCEEFGVECVVLKRKKKRTYDEIRADNLKLMAEQQKKQQQQQKLQISFMAETPQTWSKNKRTGKNKGKVNHKNAFEDKISSQHGNTGAPIIIDPETILSRKVDPANFPAFLRVTINHNMLRNLYKPNMFERTIYMRDLLEPEQLITLKINQCFTLPDGRACRRYIDLYFENHEAAHPVLSRLQFDKEFTDMRNPPSLLLLWSIFYFSATIVAKTPEQKQLSRSYYQRAKMLADATFEFDSLYYTLSLFILSIKPPGTSQSTVSFDERIRRVIKTAIGFGMNTDPQHTPYYTDYQRKLKFTMRSQYSLIPCMILCLI
ncbi:unnamed protein product [Ambrosiozyma monospora]|uniref:Unnamed protein product n=1 Tax=Ambrosiozyma monospora TaxID=43982 RepID=A0ACB5SUD1_AMBMO|nr:unnamed protein product [Ambrosiozyma monospora]